MRGEAGTHAAKRNAIRVMGILRALRWQLNLRKRPLTPTLSPHPPSPEGGFRRTRERGEGEDANSPLLTYSAPIDQPVSSPAPLPARRGPRARCAGRGE